MAPTRTTMASIYGKAAQAVSKKRGSSSPESQPPAKPYKASKPSPRRALAVVPQPQQQQVAAPPQYYQQPQPYASSSTSHIPQHPAPALPRPQAAPAPAPAPLNAAMAKYAAMRDDDRPKYFEEEYSEDIVRYFYEVDVR